VLLSGGIIRTMGPAGSPAGSVAVSGDHVAGHDDGGERVDLGGRCVVPGFTDSHVHFPTWAVAQRQVRLEGCRSRQEAVERVRVAAERCAPDRWLVGYGWRHGDWDDPAEPTRHDLDPVTGDLRTALWSRDDHSLWLNTAALAMAEPEDLHTPGGVVPRDDDGSPTGYLGEHAAWAFRRHIVITDDEYVDAMADGIGIAHRRGVTAVHDKDGWIGAARMWQRLHERGDLAIRVWQSLPVERLDMLEALGIRSGVGDDWFRLGYLKMFMDGSLSSGTAAMLDGSGVAMTGFEELVDIVRRATAAGWPLAIHAIGDAANRTALDGLAATTDLWRAAGMRQRIEHAQCVDPGDVARFASLGVAASVQFRHAPSDRHLVDQHWADLTGAYAYRSLADAGVVLANGSDAPVEELDPLAGIVSAVSRTLDDLPPWRPEQALTVEQALVASTVGPAWLAGDEHRRGKLLPGYLADLVVLSADPVTVPTDELPSVEVTATMVGGRWVNNPPPWD
jgi:predicted amidohydrolase YtcJ